ncbi:MAG: winged helix-turn-helix domain-containing protein [Lacunisphaera sp.]|nr:winged helix-turn-helix domain-containing protein [Lacunisphaera sp.]
MTLLTFADQAGLSDKERIRRIGELLATAIIRYRRRERTAEGPMPKSAPSAVLDPIGLVSDEIEKRLVRYLASAGAATPCDLSAGLGFSRATVTRKLARLRQAGIVTVSGRTKGATYKLKTDFSQN